MSLQLRRVTVMREVGDIGTNIVVKCVLQGYLVLKPPVILKGDIDIDDIN